MPTILRSGALRFFFYSLENSEPPHIHVESGDATAKYWLEPCGAGAVAWIQSAGIDPAARDNYRA
jgi:hypothetical protein